MPRLKKVLEKRGTPREELMDYFISIGGKHIEEGIYIGDKWQVKIGKESFCHMGSMKIKSIELIFYVEEEIIDEMLYKFRLKFLSAGG
jgi:hypothetical protein